MSTQVKECTKWVYNGSRDVRGHKCGRPVKRDGLCGIHAAARARREENTRSAALRNERLERLRSSAQGVCDAMAVLGIAAHPYYRVTFSSRNEGYTGGIVIEDPDTAKELLRRLEEGDNYG